MQSLGDRLEDFVAMGNIRAGAAPENYDRKSDKSSNRHRYKTTNESVDCLFPNQIYQGKDDQNNAVFSKEEIKTIQPWPTGDGVVESGIVVIIVDAKLVENILHENIITET